METISISKFKATCLAVLEQVRQTGEPVLVTKRGVPIAKIAPPSVERSQPWLGAMAGTARIEGDIVAPATPVECWEAER
jgi:prevent-host-death family protein